MTIERRKSKTTGEIRYRVKYEYKKVVYRDGTYHKKADALRAESELISRVQAGRFQARPAVVTFGTFYDLWLEHYSSKLAPSTRARYLPLIREFLLPKLKNVLVQDITATKLTRFLTGIQNEHSWSDGSYNKLLTSFQSVWRAGYEEELIQSDHLVNRLKRKAGKVELRRAPHPNEMSDLLLKLDSVTKDSVNRWMYPYSLLASTYGLRRSELFALYVEDVDFKSQTIQINKSLCLTKQVRSTKTGRCDVLPIPPLLSAILKEYVAGLEEQSVFLFPNRDVAKRGLPMEKTTAAKALRKMFIRLGHDIKIHELRHFSCSSLPTVGASQAEAISISRHSDPKTFQSVYFHARSDRQLQILDRHLETFLKTRFVPAPSQVDAIKIHHQELPHEKEAGEG